MTFEEMKNLSEEEQKKLFKIIKEKRYKVRLQILVLSMELEQKNWQES